MSIFSHHRSERSIIRRQLSIGSITCVISLLAIRMLTWYCEKLPPGVTLKTMRVICVFAIVIGLIGGVLLLSGILKWMRINSGI